MLLNTLKEIVGVYAPSGREDKLRETIKTMLMGHVDSMRVDAMGNLIVEKFGLADDAKRIMIAAHMDHIGFVVTAIEKEGFLRVAQVGGINMGISHARHVVFANGVDGVLAVQPVRDGKPGINDHFIDIGVESEEEARELVEIGDMAVYAPSFVELGKHQKSSPAMDNRVACALLIETLLEIENPKNTIVGVFTTQEEVGVRGAQVAAYSVKPDIGLAVDVTLNGDTPETKFPALKLGKGPAIKFMDHNLIASPDIRDGLIKTAEEIGVEIQREILPYGGTDGGAIQHSRGGVKTGVISIPCRYVHSPRETIDMRDMDGALKILCAYCERA